MDRYQTDQYGNLLDMRRIPGGYSGITNGTNSAFYLSDRTGDITLRRGMASVAASMAGVSSNS